MWPYLIFLIVLGATLLFGLWAECRSTAVFQEFTTAGLTKPLTGEMAARAICHKGQARVAVQSGGRWMSIQYDQDTRALSLDPHTFEGHSITSIGKAIYQAGHVLQQRQCYRWFRLRPGALPYNSFPSRHFRKACFLGLIFQLFALDMERDLSRAMDEEGGGVYETIVSVLYSLADGAFIVAALFLAIVLIAQLAALWVGLDASKRAAAALAKADFATTRSEREELRQVIQSVPFAYVAVGLIALVSMPNRTGVDPPPIPKSANASIAAETFY